MQRYRNDIEGLRSVAVVPILLFHAGVDWLRGGYTGVDVFFVVSGFLITQIILGDIEKGMFSILRFYQRRVARILPALFFVFLVCGLVAGSILILPGEIAAFFSSLAAGAAFGSNIYFWSEIDYFARAAESKPLLHTWSLGVEEQFYIFFPLLLFALRGVARATLIMVLAGIAMVSLVAGSIVQQTYPTADFYLLPFRSWELLIGSLLAVGAAPKLGPNLSSIAAIGGAGMVAASALFLVTWLPFPSPLALLPCVGTALIIAYGENTIVGRILSLAPLRWIGLISFSLYLWHWPIITFYREMTGHHLDLIETVCLVAASFAAASISFYLVEDPARQWLRGKSPKQTVIIGGISTVAVIATAVLLATNAPRIWPVSKEVEELARYEDYKEWSIEEGAEDAAECFIRSPQESLNADKCLAFSDTKRNVLLFGDSHAEMYSLALRRTFPEVNWLQATHFGCPPIIDGWLHPGCEANVDLVLNDLLASGKLDGVVMVSRWRSNQTGLLSKTIKRFRDAGVKVTVVGPVPEYQGSFPAILARAVASGTQSDVSSFLDAKIPATDAAIKAATEASGGDYLSAYGAICGEENCQLYAPDGGPITFDYGHLTVSGAKFVLGGLEQP